MRDQDVVFIEGLRLQSDIGILDYEKGIRQPVIVDLKMRTAPALVGDSEDFSRAVDYAAAASIAEKILCSGHIDLVETAAERVSTQIFEKFSDVVEVSVSISKPNALTNAAASGIKISRTRMFSRVACKPYRQAIFSMGSNDARGACIVFGLASLGKILKKADCSSCYESPANLGGPNYWNVTVVGDVPSELSRDALVARLKEIELSAGRERGFGKCRLDIDLIKNDVSDASEAPHADLQSRSYVAAPLCEVMPAYVDPFLGVAAADIVRRQGDDKSLVLVEEMPRSMLRAVIGRK